LAQFRRGRRKIRDFQIHSRSNQMSLSLKPNIESPDDFYQLLTDAQRDLSDEEANDMNARLVLVLANQIGSLSDLREAIEVTK
jgi:hypothetical protein